LAIVSAVCAQAPPVATTTAKANKCFFMKTPERKKKEKKTGF
jgi:hypothetical protein